MASTVIQFKIAFLHPSLDIDLDVGEREKKRIMYIATGVYVRFKLVYARDKNNKKKWDFHLNEIQSPKVSSILRSPLLLLVLLWNFISFPFLLFWEHHLTVSLHR